MQFDAAPADAIWLALNAGCVDARVKSPGSAAEASELTVVTITASANMG